MLMWAEAQLEWDSLSPSCQPTCTQQPCSGMNAKPMIHSGFTQDQVEQMLPTLTVCRRGRVAGTGNPAGWSFSFVKCVMWGEMGTYGTRSLQCLAFCVSSTEVLVTPAASQAMIDDPSFWDWLDSISVPVENSSGGWESLVSSN